MTERLITTRELGELLSLVPGTIFDQWEASKLPGYKMGRAVRFDPDEILTRSGERLPETGDHHEVNPEHGSVLQRSGPPRSVHVQVPRSPDAALSADRPFPGPALPLQLTASRRGTADASEMIRASATRD